MSEFAMVEGQATSSNGHRMIDLHCHILPGLDDGAANLDVSLGMAQALVADGVSVAVCTPHILPGLYHNAGPQIASAVRHLQDALSQQGIPLRLVAGADVHMVPDLIAGLRSGRIPSIAGSRYVLIEPPHHTAPPQLESFFFSLLVEGFVPILTHPERLNWLEHRYEAIRKLVGAGVWMQITSGSLTGAFGRKAQRWAYRMLDEGCVHILATDAHDTHRRRPDLSCGRDAAAARVGLEEAGHLVFTRPLGVIKNEAPANLPSPAASTGPAKLAGYAEADFPDADIERSLAERPGGRPNRHTDTYLRKFVGRLRQLAESDRW
jgi:protein-tyrosine phosphatase